MRIVAILALGILLAAGCTSTRHLGPEALPDGNVAVELGRTGRRFNALERVVLIGGEVLETRSLDRAPLGTKRLIVLVCEPDTCRALVEWKEAASYRIVRGMPEANVRTTRGTRAIPRTDIVQVDMRRTAPGKTAVLTVGVGGGLAVVAYVAGMVALGLAIVSGLGG